jgi:hypothetical protein
MLSGHNDEDELLNHLLAYKVTAHVVLLLSLSPMMLMLHGGGTVLQLACEM